MFAIVTHSITIFANLSGELNQMKRLYISKLSQVVVWRGQAARKLSADNLINNARRLCAGR